MRRIKGIPVWEQYVEFMAIGLALVLLIAFAAMQFVGAGNTVNDLRPAEVNDRLAEEAGRIDQRLNSQEQPVFPPQLAYEQFAARRDASVSPGSQLALARAFVPPGIGGLEAVDVVFVEPQLGAPARAVAQQHFDSLADGVVEHHSELQAYFREQPHDTTWLTAYATFDIDQVMARLRGGGANGEGAPVPRSWTGERLPIINVIVERETARGDQFGERIVLDCLPDQLNFRQHLAEGIDAPRRDAILNMMRENGAQQFLTQPDFLPTRNNSWTPPELQDEAAAGGEDEQARRIERLLNNRRSWMLEQQLLRKEIEENCGGPAPAPAPAPAPPPRPGPRRPGDDPAPQRPPGLPPPGGGGGGLGGPMGPEGPRPRDEARCDDLRRRLAALDRRLEGADRDLRNLGVNLEELDQEPLAEVDPRLIWAHDLTVEPGKTYRYRFVVEVYNPFFARKLNLVDAQQHLADSFTIVSEPGEWSEPIYVRPPIQTFITRVTTQQAAGVSARRARAEVYRYFDGRWWSSEFHLEPGHRIGGVKEDSRRGLPSIDYSSDWFIVDIIEDFDSSARDGRNAWVVLQRLGSDEVIEVRHPSDDLDSPVLRRLRQEVQAAEAREGA